MPEAALFAKTYCPSKIPKLVDLWKEVLKKDHPVVAQKIANPLDFPEEFGDLKQCLLVKRIKVYCKVRGFLNLD